jgi:thioredoxin-like negative regulator of GroEL
MRTTTATAKPALVVFESPRSGLCRKVDGLIAQVLASRARRQALRLLRVPVEERPDLVERFRVAEVPTLVVVAERRVAARIEQPRHLDELEAFLAPFFPAA